MAMALGELQARNLGAAERLMRLSIDHGLGVTALLAALARELFELNLQHWGEIAGAEASEELLRLRTEHAGRVAGRLIHYAARLAELGSEVRAGFSRLLTEQLAAGNQGLMDAFQGFFAVLPTQGADFPQMLALAAERAERALGEVEALVRQVAPADAGAGPKQMHALARMPDLMPPFPVAAALALDRPAA